MNIATSYDIINESKNKVGEQYPHTVYLLENDNNIHPYAFSNKMQASYKGAQIGDNTIIHSEAISDATWKTLHDLGLIA